jgi:hypothetical protein
VNYRFFANFLFSAAVAAASVGVVQIAAERQELEELDPARLPNALVITGRLEIPKHSGRSTIVRIKDAHGFQSDCYIGYCGYSGVWEDVGKQARAWIVNGKLAQIEVDGQFRLTFEKRRSVHQRSVTLGFIYVGLAPMFLLAGLLLRRKSKVGAQQ